MNGNPNFPLCLKTFLFILLLLLIIIIIIIIITIIILYGLLCAQESSDTAIKISRQKVMVNPTVCSLNHKRDQLYTVLLNLLSALQAKTRKFFYKQFCVCPGYSMEKSMAGHWLELCRSQLFQEKTFLTGKQIAPVFC